MPDQAAAKSFPSPSPQNSKVNIRPKICVAGHHHSLSTRAKFQHPRRGDTLPQHLWNRIESKTGAAGSERPGRGGGRGGVIRGATVGNRGHEGAEREREIGRRRKLFSLFEIEIYRTIYFTSIFFYPFFIFPSLSLSPRTTIPGTTDDAGTTRGRRDVTRPPSLPLSSTLRTTPFPPSCHSHL